MHGTDSSPGGPVEKATAWSPKGKYDLVFVVFSHTELAVVNWLYPAFHMTTGPPLTGASAAGAKQFFANVELDARVYPSFAQKFSIAVADVAQDRRQSRESISPRILPRWLFSSGAILRLKPCQHNHQKRICQ